jgi:VWFA-related protein
MPSWLTASIVFMAWGAGVPAGAVAPGQRPAREQRDQQVIVSVLDRSGKPVSGLTPADFVVREDGVAREVLRVEQAATPMQIVVLVDTSSDMQLALQDLKPALRTFSRAIWAKSPDSDIALMEFGERPNQLGSPAKSPVALDPRIDNLFEHQGSGGYLLDALADAAHLLKARNAARPVVVVFSREATQEFSARRADQAEATVKDARLALWAIVLQENGAPNASDEARQRDLVLGDTAARSGGTREIVLHRMGLEPTFAQLADRLTGEYVVTYSRPDSLIPPTRIEVSVKREGARALATHWTGQ